ncbi:hypothetical protein Q7P37_011147 [Cladosporium fusiforme]
MRNARILLHCVCPPPGADQRTSMPLTVLMVPIAQPIPSAQLDNLGNGHQALLTFVFIASFDCLAILRPRSGPTTCRGVHRDAWDVCICMATQEHGVKELDVAYSAGRLPGDAARTSSCSVTQSAVQLPQSEQNPPNKFHLHRLMPLGDLGKRPALRITAAAGFLPACTQLSGLTALQLHAIQGPCQALKLHQWETLSVLPATTMICPPESNRHGTTLGSTRHAPP